jgi:hypothetical protein
MKPLSEITALEWIALAVVVVGFIAWRVYKARKK